MSLEQLIEEDMGRFLESEMRTEKKEPVVRLEEVYHNRHDWESDIRIQIKRGDIAAAKRIFNECKKHYESIPEAHAMERNRNYEVLQKCYVAIVNANQDSVRTQIILQRMAQSPDDVFDANVRPVNLQQAQHTAYHMPDPETVMNQQFAVQEKSHAVSMPSPPFEGAPNPSDNTGNMTEKKTHDIAMPSPPVDGAPTFPATSAGVPAGRTSSIDLPLPPQEKVTLSTTSEDELIEALKPAFMKIKSAIHSHDRTAFLEGISELERFTVALPPSQNRSLLENAAATLRQKAIAKVGDVVTSVRPLLDEIRLAQQQKDHSKFLRAVKSLEDFTSQLPPSVERTQLNSTVQRLRSHVSHEVKA